MTKQDLDVKSQKGQVSRQQELIVINRILKAFPGVQLIETNKDKPAIIDIILARQNVITAIGEIKCREFSKEKIERLGNTTLITMEKIENCRIISEMLRCPFFLFVYLNPDDQIYYWQMTDSDGNYKFNFETRITETQATINGGKATRLTAFIDYKHAKQL